ncbi:MAG: hypothetical protein WD845_00390 [Pirellulales bacterium]
MKSAFWKVLLALTLCVVGFGFYRGWFNASSYRRETPTQQVGVSLTLDQDKLKEDAQRVREKATELRGKATDEAK